nr:PREDICTED: 52 kDa repressor of the inhibitor of the protein kinase-like isoform X2 [Megachile rotundata]
MSERGGYRCCIKGCQSATSEKRGIKETLFRFPKDVEKSKLWASMCGREDLFSKTPIQLYNNYRVCKLHFANDMFLNYEKTKLQPHAVPSNIMRNNDEEASSSNSNVETLYIIASNNENTQKESTVLDISTFNGRNLDVIHTNKTIAKVSDAATQTPLSLSSFSPRKTKLCQQIRGYKRKIANLELQLQQAKEAKKEDINTLDMLLDKYFPKQKSEYLKAQARLFQKDAKGIHQ